MTTITPEQAQAGIDRAFVLASLASIHTTWGEIAWNAGDTRRAVRYWMTAARYSVAAKQEGTAR